MSCNDGRIVCLGNFDGVHLGHRALFERALSERAVLQKKGADVECGVLTFSQPTHNYLDKIPPPRITSADERERLIFEAGMEFVITLDFAELRDMEPEQFVRDILVDEYGCILAVCGYDFHFGCGGSGDSALLSSLMSGSAAVVEPVRLGDTVISSTAIRSAVERGDMETAAQMLGRPWSFSSTVEHGHGIGAELGFATLNQRFAPGFLMPARGVYASRCTVGDKSYPAVSNVGCRPTFTDGDSVLCETHIIGLSADLYDTRVRTELHHFMRDEQRFDSPEQLQRAVRRDIEAAAEYFGEKC